MKPDIVLRTAADIMTQQVLAFNPDDDLMDAVQVMTRNDWSGAPVINDAGEVVGILCETDIIHILAQAAYEETRPERTVGEAMHHGADTISPTDDLFEIAQKMRESSHQRLPVVQNGHLVGIVTQKDVMRALEATYAENYGPPRVDTFQERLRDLRNLLRGT